MATYLPRPSKQHSKMNWIIIHLKRNDRGPKGRGSKMFFIKDYSFPKSLKQRRKRHLTIFGHSLLFLKKANFRNEYNLLFSSLYNFNKRSFVPWKLTSSIAVSIREVVKGGKKPNFCWPIWRDHWHHNKVRIVAKHAIESGERRAKNQTSRGTLIF